MRFSRVVVVSREERGNEWRDTEGSAETGWERVR